MLSSKSTKRRRFLEEVETLECLKENNDQFQFIPQSASTSLNSVAKYDPILNDNNMLTVNHTTIK